MNCFSRHLPALPLPAARLEFVPNELPMKEIIRDQPLKPLPPRRPSARTAPPPPSSPLPAAASGQNGGRALPAAIAPPAARTIFCMDGGGDTSGVRVVRPGRSALLSPPSAPRVSHRLFAPFSSLRRRCRGGPAGLQRTHRCLSPPPYDKMAPPRSGRAPLSDA